jgi:hypothetical protein
MQQKRFWTDQLCDIRRHLQLYATIRNSCCLEIDFAIFLKVIYKSLTTLSFESIVPLG